MKALEFIGFVTGHYRPKQDVNVNHTITVKEEQELMHRLKVLNEQARRLGIDVPTVVDAHYEEIKPLPAPAE